LVDFIVTGILKTTFGIRSLSLGQVSCSRGLGFCDFPVLSQFLRQLAAFLVWMVFKAVGFTVIKLFSNYFLPICEFSINSRRLVHTIKTSNTIPRSTKSSEAQRNGSAAAAGLARHHNYYCTFWQIAPPWSGRAAARWSRC
jgi:hypothetical protein